MQCHLKRLGAAAILIAGATSVNLASATDDFSDRTLRGTWALFVQGHSGPATPPALPSETPLFAIATVTFDGAGGCESRDRIVIGNRDVPNDDSNAPGPVTEVVGRRSQIYRGCTGHMAAAPRAHALVLPFGRQLPHTASV